MFNKRPSFFRYLPLSPDDRQWGLYITTAGHSRSHPESSGYPPDKHPSAYHFEWHQGRILDDFQIVHIVRGEGVFESASHGKSQIKEGATLLLFPGEWHRYKPNPKTGWDECWIGFDGSIPRDLVKSKASVPPHRYSCPMTVAAPSASFTCEPSRPSSTSPQPTRKSSPDSPTKCSRTSTLLHAVPAKKARRTI